MTKRTRRTLSPEFKLEATQLVVYQSYSVVEAAKAMNVSKSAMDKWVRQIKQERLGFCAYFSEKLNVNCQPFINDGSQLKHIFHRNAIWEQWEEFQHSALW